MRVAFVGVGRVGSLALRLFAEEYPDAEIIAIDKFDRNNIIKELGGSIAFHRAHRPPEVCEIVRNVDVVATALPSDTALPVVRELLTKGRNVVDVSFMDIDPYMFENLCRKNETFYIFDAGFSPGFSNLVAGHIYDVMGTLDLLGIYVGGIPTQPVPPIKYQITWNPEDLIEEYVRPARVIINGSIRTVDPLERILKVEIPGLGRFEGFYCDNLRTLLRNVKAKEMFYVTLRHEGHLSIMKTLRDLGFFAKDEIDVSGCRIAPYKFTAEMFGRKLQQTIPDQAILYIVASGNGKRYELLTHLIGKRHRSATAYYTALVYAKTCMMALKEELSPGIYPLEHLSYYDEYLKYLKDHGVSVDERFSDL